MKIYVGPLDYFTFMIKKTRGYSVILRTFRQNVWIDSFQRLLVYILKKDYSLFRIMAKMDFRTKKNLN